MWFLSRLINSIRSASDTDMKTTIINLNTVLLYTSTIRMEMIKLQRINCNVQRESARNVQVGHNAEQPKKHVRCSILLF